MSKWVIRALVACQKYRYPSKLAIAFLAVSIFSLFVFLSIKFWVHFMGVATLLFGAMTIYSMKKECLLFFRKKKPKNNSNNETPNKRIDSVSTDCFPCDIKWKLWKKFRKPTGYPYQSTNTSNNEKNGS